MAPPALATLTLFVDLQVDGWILRVLGAGGLVVAGAVVGWVVRWVGVRLLRVWSDRLSGGAVSFVGGEFQSQFGGAHLDETSLSLFGRSLFVLVFLVFVAAATETLELPVVSTWVLGLAGYLPQVFAAALVMVLGLLAGSVLRIAVAQGASTAGLEYAAPFGRMVQLGVIGVSAVVAVDQLGIEVSFLGHSLPVLDFDGRMIGVIRSPEVVEAAERAATADIQKMVGAGSDERALSPPLLAVRKRLPWLYANLLTAFIAASVVGIFEDTIARFTARAVLLPVVAGQAGNSGAQTLAVAMRGLALREFRVSQWRRGDRSRGKSGGLPLVGISRARGEDRDVDDHGDARSRSGGDAYPHLAAGARAGSRPVLVDRAHDGDRRGRLPHVPGARHAPLAFHLTTPALSAARLPCYHVTDGARLGCPSDGLRLDLLPVRRRF